MTAHPLVAAQRRNLAAQLTGLPVPHWETETLCSGWTVRHVVAHLLMPFRYSKPRYAIGMLCAGGNFNRFADRVARRDATANPDDLVRRLRENTDNPWQPPGGGYEGALTDLVVHSLDIARPLGVAARIDPIALGVVLDTLVSAQSRRFFGIDLDGLELRASDIEWTHGGGRSVVGPAEDLVLALTRRRTPLDLRGDGADRLAGCAR
jgi:uncharacterized protein (TIGR03083 family)